MIRLRSLNVWAFTEIRSGVRPPFGLELLPQPGQLFGHLHRWKASEGHFGDELLFRKLSRNGISAEEPPARGRFRADDILAVRSDSLSQVPIFGSIVEQPFPLQNDRVNVAGSPAILRTRL